MMAEARALLDERRELPGYAEAEVAVFALERGNEPAALRWALRALLAHPAWRALAHVVLGD